MISAQLPRLRPFLLGKLPPAWSQRILPVLQNLRVNLGGWFRAQCKLMGLTFLLLTIGFLILRVEFPLLLGALIALVDALAYVGHRYNSCTLGTPGAVAGTNGPGSGADCPLWRYRSDPLHSGAPHGGGISWGSTRC